MIGRKLKKINNTMENVKYYKILFNMRNTKNDR